MNKAILYIRVSTDEQADKGYSQRNQEEVLQRYCALKGWPVQEVIFEDHSAKTFNRPAWSAMLGTLRKTRNKAHVAHILFTKWDRFSRNTADAYQMISLLRSLGIEPQAIEQPLDLSVPENKMMLAFYLAVPEVENDRRALNIFHGMRRAKKEGRWISSAPTGYINRSAEDGRKYIRPCEPQASIMRDAFQLIATGKFATDQVWKMARQQGLRCGRMNFWNLIRNPVYCGKIVVQGYRDEEPQLAEGQHEALISEELFKEVQRVLERRKVKKGTKITSLTMMPLRGFLQCPGCGRMLTGSGSRGRSASYHYYHCRLGCPTRFKTEEVNHAFAQWLDTLKPHPAILPVFRDILCDVFKQQSAGAQLKRLQVVSQLDSLKNRLQKARDLLLTEALNAEEYREIKTSGEQNIGTLQKQLEQLPDTEPRITKLLNRHQNELLDLNRLFSGAELEDKRRLLDKLLAAACVYEQGGFRSIELGNTFNLVYRRGLASFIS